MKNNESFSYSYSASQQQEIDAIRRKYLPKTADKMETLRALDRSAELAGTIASIIAGVIGVLIMGGGLSLCLVYTDTQLVPGIILGLVGIIAIALAYPSYVFITKKRREKIAPQVMALIEELSK